MTRGRHGRSKMLKLDRQLSLRLDSTVEPSFARIANRVDSVRENARNQKTRPIRGTFPSLESLANHVQALDRLRLLAPTSMPKVLRGWDPRPRPKTAIIAYAAQRAYERRIARERDEAVTQSAIDQFMGLRDRRLTRLARRLRQSPGE